MFQFFGEVVNPMHQFLARAFSLIDFWDLQKEKHQCSKNHCTNREMRYELPRIPKLC